MAIDSVNPTTGEVIETFAETSPAALEASLAGAWDAFVEWRRVPFAGRAELLRAAAQMLRVRKVDFARTMALEMGKPVVQGEEEVEKCAWGCEFYADHGAAFLAEQPTATEATRSYVRFRSGRSSASRRRRSWRGTPPS
jgi:succinate-semialdehyde dehydrogenase/glutarate-semialdehyde dehydrogenase